MMNEPMRRSGILSLALATLVSACAGQPRPAEEVDSVSRGAALAEENCAACHATGREGASSFPGAPPLRALSQRYSIWTLEEALAEGILVGHPAMPPFQFDPEDVTDLLAYIQSIQEVR